MPSWLRGRRGAAVVAVTLAFALVVAGGYAYRYDWLGLRTAYTKIKWRLDGPNKIVVTYQSYAEKDETGKGAFDVGTADDIVGTSYTATFVSTGFLRRSHHDSEFQFGNKALCGKGATQANRNECNV
ncbi:hypothetical protein GCM10010399_31030 [Dactylosporangium fulvum]|uniref:Uncharacterized protein n=1 Tax=Dactylosporangium fulvum TaxID=53359 RepID=A0ABY5W5U1_9ACTN|nr:hypothetical protein [Dactylosporangium fulvum]UWP85345.1 hypothetical protein Dfulv_14365 [Dactylosporangium fulvum]